MTTHPPRSGACRRRIAVPPVPAEPGSGLRGHPWFTEGMDPAATGVRGPDDPAASGVTEPAAVPAAMPGPVSRMMPAAAAVVKVDLPETLRYRLKNKLLGPPLVNEQLGDERLGRPSALGVLAPDCISSSAYGTEEMLTQLVPYIGLAAFAMVVPITMAILGVLFFVTLSYLDVIALYTKAGGAYVVARENFGPKVAQIAAVALLIDYTVTVAVQTAAGTAALTSAFPTLLRLRLTVPITVAVVLFLLYGNLRGIREAGKFFAFPTYFFIFSLSFVVIAGYVKEALGTLQVHSVQHAGTLPIGHAGSGLLYGASFIIILRSFANGGSSLTGLEAISNGVGPFREPTARHARQTLVIMSTVLAFSNGIIVLTVVAVALLIATGAKVSSLVALYAIGVFTGFAMAGAGMVKHHWDNKEAHWRRNVAINAISAFLTALIILIFATVKFKEGAWVVVVVGPLMYFGLVRLHRQYTTEEHQLEEGAAEAAEAPVLLSLIHISEPTRPY